MTEKVCKLAVVFPVYNGEDTLENSLQCIADQDYRDFRAFIVENHSTDRSREIAQAFCARDKRFEIVECPDHLGIIDNFVRAITVGRDKAEFFCLRACDDLSSLDYLSKLMAAIEADDTKLLAVGSTERISDRKIQSLRPNTDTLNFYPNLLKGKVAKTLFFPSEWFYGIIRSDDGAEIFLRRWPALGTPWCAASFTVAEIVMRGRAVWVDGPIYQFFRGSGSEKRYPVKKLRDKIARRLQYARGCYAVVDKLPPLPLLTRLKVFRLSWRDAGRKTGYRIRRHIKDGFLSAIGVSVPERPL